MDVLHSCARCCATVHAFSQLYIGQNANLSRKLIGRCGKGCVGKTLVSSLVNEADFSKILPSRQVKPFRDIKCVKLKRA